MKDILFKLNLMILISVSISQEVRSQSNLFNDKQSRHWGLNLKDSVKSVRFIYTKQKDGLNHLDLSRIYLKNDIRTDFYLEFTKYGNISIRKMFIKSIDEIVHKDSVYQYFYDCKDIKEKDDFFVNSRYIHPVYYDGLIRLNFIEHANLEGTKSQVVYNYVVKNGKIKEEKQYFLDVDGTVFKNRFYESELVYKKIYSYDKSGNLLSQKIFAGQFGKEIGNIAIMETEAPYCDDTEIQYSYDTKGRVIKVIVFSCKNIVTSEQYTYHSSRDYITTLKRYISNPSFSSYPSKNMIAEYNEHGDIIHMHFVVENDTSPPQKKIGTEPVDRYYEYDYDSHNNWIKCRLFLMGDKDEPTLIAERRIEYYNDKKK